jgi:GNAT superfamily N-acetyltransferase
MRADVPSKQPMSDALPGYRLREATVADAAVLARQRRAMFDVMGQFGSTAEGDELEAVARRWIEREIAAGTFYSWVVEAEFVPGDALPATSGEANAPDARMASPTGSDTSGRPRASGPPPIVSGGGLQVRPLMPRPGHVRGEPEALILSMWTDPAHRRRGLATCVLEAMLDWCRRRGIRRVTLHASAQGRPIYERLGFTQTNEMRLELQLAATPNSRSS